MDFVFNQTCTVILFGHGKEPASLKYLEVIVNVREGLGMVENGFSAPFLLKKRMGFDETCIYLLLGKD